MNTTTKILLIIWIFIIFDSFGAVICKWLNFCRNSSLVDKIITAKGVPINNNWPYVYLVLAILGLLTILLMIKSK